MKTTVQSKATKKKYKNTGFGAFLTLLFLVCLGFVMFWVASQMIKAEDVSDLKENLSANQLQPNLSEDMERALTRKQNITISETEFNALFAEKLRFSQGGLFHQWVQVEGMFIRLKQDYAELILMRTVFGKPHSVAMRFSYKKIDGVAKFKVLGQDDSHFSARFGSLSIPRGGVQLILPIFTSLRDALSEEVALIERMSTVRIEEGRVVLEP